MLKLIIFLFLSIFSSSLFAYESEEKLQAMIIGKIVKFITWEDEKSKTFTITILNNPFGTTFDELYQGKQIKDKDVVIKYITKIEQIGKTDILYIANVTSQELETILQKVKNSNILTISDLRGFAEKKGIVQVYFASQKPKLKINLESAKEENMQIKSSLLQIADVVKGL